MSEDHISANLKIMHVTNSFTNQIMESQTAKIFVGRQKAIVLFKQYWRKIISA